MHIADREGEEVWKRTSGDYSAFAEALTSVYEVALREFQPENCDGIEMHALMR